jgi:hypothetical protein
MSCRAHVERGLAAISQVSILEKLAEVVGSNPTTRSIFINLGNYGIKSGSFSVVARHPVRHFLKKLQECNSILH